MMLQPSERRQENLKAAANLAQTDVDALAIGEMDIFEPKRHARAPYGVNGV